MEPKRHPDQSRPAEFKTVMDGRGGLILAMLRGGPHDGRELYIDELDLPPEIWTAPAGSRFEWWPTAVHEEMGRTAVGGDPDRPPVRYVLEVAEATGEPAFVADDGSA